MVDSVECFLKVKEYSEIDLADLCSHTNIQYCLSAKLLLNNASIFCYISHAINNKHGPESHNIDQYGCVIV